jgi:putative MFS transporter
MAAILFIDMFDLTMAGSIMGGLTGTHWMTVGQSALFLAATGLGGATGNFLGGVLADRYGRKPTMRIALLVVGVFTLLCASATSPFWLCVFRLISAFGMGALPTLCYLLMIESLPGNVRVRWTAGCGAVANVAILVAGLFAYLLVPAGDWRWMFILPGAGSLLAILLLRLIPESLLWLDLVGRRDDARAVLIYFGGDQAVVEQSKVAVNDKGKPAPPSPNVPFGQNGLLRWLFVAIIIALCANISSNGTLAWLPTMLMHKGFSIKDSLKFNLVITSGVPAGTLLAALFADRLPRRLTIGLASAMCVLCTIVFALSQNTAIALFAGFGSLLLILFTYGIAVGVYIHELFSTSVRGRAVSTASSISRVGLILIPFPMSWLIQNVGAFAPMWVIAGLMGLLGTTVALLGRETRGMPLDN